MFTEIEKREERFLFDLAYQTEYMSIIEIQSILRSLTVKIGKILP
jgi:hypothetical protein